MHSVHKIARVTKNYRRYHNRLLNEIFFHVFQLSPVNPVHCTIIHAWQVILKLSLRVTPKTDSFDPNELDVPSNIEK